MKKFPLIIFPAPTIIIAEPAKKQVRKNKIPILQGVQKMANSKKNAVPAARAALDQFKMEAANEVGVNLNNSYNGDITARQAGSVGGQMVKKMIEKYENDLKNGNR